MSITECLLITILCHLIEWTFFSNLYFFSHVLFIFVATDVSRQFILIQYAAYANKIEQLEGIKTRRGLFKPIMSMFHNCYNSRLYRIALNNYATDRGNDKAGDLILRAYENTMNQVMNISASDSPSSEVITRNKEIVI